MAKTKLPTNRKTSFSLHAKGIYVIYLQPIIRTKSFFFKSLYKLLLSKKPLTHYSKKPLTLYINYYYSCQTTIEGKEEDVRLGANRYAERQPLGTAAQGAGDRDYTAPHGPLFEPGELSSWPFYRAGIAEFVATFLFLYITVLTVMGVSRSGSKCASVGIQGITWAFGGMIFALVYCTAGISGGHINPAVTFGLLLARKLSLSHALFYMIMQCLGAICVAGVVKGFVGSTLYTLAGGGANVVSHGYTKGDGLGVEIVDTFVLVYTVFSATDSKRSARDSHVPILVPLPMGFAVFLVHLATIPITGTGINPARSLGATIIYNKAHAWNDHWIYWVGPFTRAALAALYHQVVIRAMPFKSIHVMIHCVSFLTP